MQRVGRRELVRNLGEIFHVRADDDRLREVRRLQNIVAAALGEGSAHEDHIGSLEERGQLADGIEQENTWEKCRKIERRFPRQGTAADETNSPAFQLFSDYL